MLRGSYEFSRRAAISKAQVWPNYRRTRPGSVYRTRD